VTVLRWARKVVAYLLQIPLLAKVATQTNDICFIYLKLEQQDLGNFKAFSSKMGSRDSSPCNTETSELPVPKAGCVHV
jgi:hypothetical protein